MSRKTTDTLAQKDIDRRVRELQEKMRADRSGEAGALLRNAVHAGMDASLTALLGNEAEAFKRKHVAKLTKFALRQTLAYAVLISWTLTEGEV